MFPILGLCMMSIYLHIRQSESSEPETDSWRIFSQSDELPPTAASSTDSSIGEGKVQETFVLEECLLTECLLTECLLTY